MSIAIKSISEISVTGADALPAYIFDAKEPLVLRGLASDWEIVSAAHGSDKHVADYLLNFDQGTPLTVYQGNPEIKGRIFYNESMTGFNFERTRQTMSAVLAALFAEADDAEPNTYYVGSTLVDRWLPGFRAHNDLPIGHREHLTSLWFGNRSLIAAHYDVPSNIAVCAAGRRQFTLFPPEQAENLYIGPLDLTPSGQPISLVNADAPELDQFPKYRTALQAACQATLEPGDAIFIPSMWWHQVKSLDAFNVLVNYWWRATPAYMGAPLNALQHAVLSIRELPPEQRVVWRDIFERYVFAATEQDWSHIPKHARGVLDDIDEARAQSIRAQLRRFLQ
ncbi:cupin [Arenicella chitinivorans]|uniref:Cupin n=1 Tax=Arenicella chitinivorans TaxID=1329800 RepID=A0A918VPR6_9GAMM|nr:cupin-like domain-containing protein [Arenicella chitinivorans]GHA13354.1 cupin [Arenicella chitinivorans]